MKGIILAGGRGTRLYPTTLSVPKSCSAVYNKPMLYYPISVMILAGITDIMLICDSKYDSLFHEMVKNLKIIGINIKIGHQNEPNGIAESFVIAEEFVGDDSVCLVLGDNFLFGGDLSEKLIQAREEVEKNGGAHIFGFGTRNPKNFGIATVKNDKVIKLEEKPKNPKSNWAVIGVYMYDKNAAKFSKNLEKSDRGEFEITDLNKKYLSQEDLRITLLGRGFTWFDMGNHDDMLDASNFVRAVEKNQGYKIGCLEEIAYNNKIASREEIQRYLSTLHSCSSEYYVYVKNLFEE